MRFLWLALGLLLSACTANVPVRERIFSLAEARPLVYSLPSSLGELVIQPFVLLPRQQSALAAVIGRYPYEFRYSLLDGKKQAISSASAHGDGQCQPSDQTPPSPETQDSYPCEGRRLILDLAAAQGRARYLRIEGHHPQKLYFAIFAGLQQSDYKSRMQWFRLSQHERQRLHHTVYGGEKQLSQEQQQNLMRKSLHRLAPIGSKGKDYRELSFFEKPLNLASRAVPRAFEVLGEGARIILPISPATAEVNLQILPFAANESISVRACWQPLAEPIEGRCYLERDISQGKSSLNASRGRLIFSSQRPVMLHASYAMTLDEDGSEKTINLQEVVRKYSAYRLENGGSIQLPMHRLPDSDYLPLRVLAWSLDPQLSKRSRLLIHSRAEDGTLRAEHIQALPHTRSDFDRPEGRQGFAYLSQPKEIYLNGSGADGNLEIKVEGGPVLISFMTRRDESPATQILYGNGFISGDPERPVWNVMDPLRADQLSKESVYSYASDEAATRDQGETQYLSLSAMDAGLGRFAMVPSSVQDLSFEERSGGRGRRYYELPPDHSIKGHLEPDAFVDFALAADKKGRKLQAYVNELPLWTHTVGQGLQEFSSDLSRRLPDKSIPVEIRVEGEGLHSVFVRGVQPGREPERFFSKRFFHALPPKGLRFQLEKTLDHQLLLVQLISERKPDSAFRIAFALEEDSPNPSFCCAEEYSLLRREFSLLPSSHSERVRLMDGESEAYRLLIPIALKSDLPRGHYHVKLAFVGIDAAWASISTQASSTGVRIGPAREDLVSGMAGR